MRFTFVQVENPNAIFLLLVSFRHKADLTPHMQIQQLKCCFLSVIILFNPTHEVPMFNIKLYYFITALMGYCNNSFYPQFIKITTLVFLHHTIQYIKFNQLPAAAVTSPSFKPHQRRMRLIAAA